MISRIRFASIIFMVTGLAFAGIPTRAQNVFSDAFYNKPQELKLEHTKRGYFRDYRRQRPGEDFYFESFYPIGWSKDGKLAYYFEPDAGESGCYFAKLFILDLKTDKVAWSFDYDGNCLGEPTQGDYPKDFATLWKANQKLFSEKLREHGIEALEQFSLLSFPLTHKGDRLTAKLRTKEKSGLTDEDRLYGVVGKATLQLVSSRKGNKTILEHSYDKTRPLYVGSVGYLKSPFEPRVAVVLIEITRGWEGPPHSARVRIVGASLESGFRLSKR